MGLPKDGQKFSHGNDGHDRQQWPRDAFDLKHICPKEDKYRRRCLDHGIECETNTDHAEIGESHVCGRHETTGDRNAPKFLPTQLLQTRQPRGFGKCLT
eukprot:scaffold36689_cov199-Amphora_coffeaeformis.AAC.3